MSINLWVLSTAVADRVGRGVPVDLVLDDLIDTASTPPPRPPVIYETRPLVVEPNPAPGGCVLRFSLAAPRNGSLTVFDASGREVRALESGGLGSARAALGRPRRRGPHHARRRLLRAPAPGPERADAAARAAALTPRRRSLARIGGHEGPLQNTPCAKPSYASERESIFVPSAAVPLKRNTRCEGSTTASPVEFWVRANDTVAVALVSS